MHRKEKGEKDKKQTNTVNKTKNWFATVFFSSFPFGCVVIYGYKYGENTAKFSTKNNKKKKKEENPHKDSSYINNVVGKRERKRRRASHATGVFGHYTILFVWWWKQSVIHDYRRARTAEDRPATRRRRKKNNNTRGPWEKRNEESSFWRNGLKEVKKTSYIIGWQSQRSFPSGPHNSFPFTIKKNKNKREIPRCARYEIETLSLSISQEKSFFELTLCLCVFVSSFFP